MQARSSSFLKKGGGTRNIEIKLKKIKINKSSNALFVSVCVKKEMVSLRTQILFLLITLYYFYCSKKGVAQLPQNLTFIIKCVNLIIYIDM